MKPTFDFEVACALSKGNRSYQEDAIIADFARGVETGVAVLADGMGGHAAGDIASKIVVTEVFSELAFQRNNAEDFEQNITSVLHDAAMAANGCLRDHVLAYPETHGMGATLVAPVIIGASLYWISIGDSPLFLFRGGELRQLNEDHSMAPQIDFMVKSGLINVEDAKSHPDRNTLTSVLFGDAVAKIDCPEEPLQLRDDDILIVASDGLQFLSDEDLTRLLRENQHRHSTEIADLFLSQLVELDDPDLDNVSFSIIKLHRAVSREALSTAVSETGLRCVG